MCPVAERGRLLARALRLGWFTVVYNVAEGIVAVSSGLVTGSGALVAFGLDSGVESLSGGVLIWRLRVEQREPERAEAVERRALRFIGVTFFVLAAYVTADAGWSLIEAEEPDSSVVGIVLTALSLVVMPVLARRKRLAGEAMGSRTVIADSVETRACVYLSAVVLSGLVFNASLGWWWADPVSALGVVVFLVREGFEAFSDED